MNIIQAIADQNLFRPFLGQDLTTWRNWGSALRCVYGLPVPGDAAAALVQQCTGRTVDSLPPMGFDIALFLTGRRCGKRTFRSENAGATSIADVRRLQPDGIVADGLCTNRAQERRSK